MPSSCMMLSTSSFIPLSIDAIEESLIHLPVNANLISIALADKFSLAPSLLTSIPLARRHFRHQHESSGLGLWEFLDACNIKYEGWTSLPFTYKIVIYGEMLRADDWAHSKTVANPEVNSLMWPERWNLPPDLALRLIKTKMRESRHFSSSSKDNRLIIWTSRLGHAEMVSMLLQDPKVDPSARSGAAIRIASQKGHAGVLQVLLADPRVDPAVLENYAIRLAAQNGYLEACRILLKDERVDPSAQNCAAVISATTNGHYDVARLLLSHRIFHR
ncbi:UNVERIFIED_CONTAM: hypothetical protein HDU68_006840 [Siphonaria sp. JEL0065]|nr:hypothetical protein HDU68_006840 [Siphonaria sp. JEL0065]